MLGRKPRRGTIGAGRRQLDYALIPLAIAASITAASFSAFPQIPGPGEISISKRTGLSVEAGLYVLEM